MKKLDNAMALEKIALENILFLDIETVPEYPNYTDLPQVFKDLWAKKSRRFHTETEGSEEVYGRAGIFAEFGKIVCISAGYFHKSESGENLRITSFYGSDEKVLLSEFGQMVNTYFGKSKHYLCAHNGKEFDFPYIARRCLINGISIPANMDTRGLKPWDVKHLDTLELWRFGDYKNYTSLPLLAALFGIPTPKDDIDGSLVADVFWKENDIHRIVNYCQKDVVAIAQLYRKYRGMELLDDNSIDIIEKDTVIF